MAERELTPQEALSYLDDIAHGRKMKFDPHVLYCIVKNALEANDVLRIIFEAPFILERLFELGKLGNNAKQRYMWGTIAEKDVEKVKEFFADVEMRNKSKQRFCQ